ncbi:thiamine phosphate synthase [Algirhabdus cladophorae]|uniref:thiamine phosphate synthase n=1 Tax=Algirhabdus cladophorae TaxID=3377108 RepID=UPI003B84748A
MTEPSEPTGPQIYLITPPEIELSRYPAQLAGCLDSVEVGCVRMALASQDEDLIARAGDALREVCHARDVALVITDHVLMVERLGLDGVHLADGSRNVRKTRKDLGEDAIVGAFCGTTRHDAMSAAEAGADYAALGPVGASPLGDGESAALETFEWWSEMIEVPIVAEGHLDADLIRQYAPVTDFFGIGPEIWIQDDAVAALKALSQAMA